MKHFTARLRLPKLSKILIQNDRLNMSPVEEDCEDQNDTQVRQEEQQSTFSSMKKKQLIQGCQDDSNQSMDSQANAKFEDLERITGSQRQICTFLLQMKDLPQAKTKRHSLTSMNDGSIQITQSLDESLQDQDQDYESDSPVPLQLVSILSELPTQNQIIHKAISLNFQFTVNLSTDIDRPLPIQSYTVGEEVLCSRITSISTSKLQQFFVQRVNGNQKELFVEVIEDDFKCRLSQYSPELCRSRSTQKINSICRVFGNFENTTDSPKVGDATNKSEKLDFVSFNKLQEMSNENHERKTFSMSIHQQQQKQNKSSFLRRSCKKDNISQNSIKCQEITQTPLRRKPIINYQKKSSFMLDEEVSLVNKIFRKFKKLFKIKKVKKQSTFRRKNTQEVNQDNDQVRVRIVIAITTLSIVFLILVFSLSLLKYKIEKL